MTCVECTDPENGIHCQTSAWEEDGKQKSALQRSSQSMYEGSNLKFNLVHVAVTDSKNASCDLHTQIIITVLYYSNYPGPLQMLPTPVKHVKLCLVNLTYHSFSASLAIFSAW